MRRIFRGDNEKNFSEIEQQAALFEQGLHVHRRVAVATVDQARME